MKNPKSPEVRYRNQLRSLVGSLKQEVETTIYPILKSYEHEYVQDAYATTLQQAFNRLRASYNNIGLQAQRAAEAFVGNVDNTQRQRFYKAMENATGVNLNSIIQNEGLEDTLVGAVNENVNLIKSIPDEYFKKIETVVWQNTTRGLKSSSLIKEIQKINNTTEKRAKLIARDQTSKLNSNLNEKRQKNLGIEEYIWRTSEDGRVRDTHRHNNGKRFRWDSPPKETGHPGQDINCRCVAQPIINL